MGQWSNVTFVYSMTSCRLLLLCILVGSSVLPAQQLLELSPGSPPRLMISDRAILSSPLNRDDLNCRVVPLKPQLDFELKYQIGYLIHLPMEAVAVQGDNLQVLFRIHAQDDEKADPVYFQQNFQVPPLSDEQQGEVVLPGRYVLGPGRYKVDWMMRDRMGRVCSAHWKTEINLTTDTEPLATAPAENDISPYKQDIFAEEPPVVRKANEKELLHVSLLLNLAPVDQLKFKLSNYELQSIIAMLRTLHREPGFGLFSLTAFNATNQKIVYKSEQNTRLDFAALGKAVESMQPGLIDAATLTDPESRGRFMADVLNGALHPGGKTPDTVVIIGPKIDREARIAELNLVWDGPTPQLIQFVFDQNPLSYPWQGALSRVLKSCGIKTYTITRPQDYYGALIEVLESFFLLGHEAENL